MTSRSRASLIIGVVLAVAVLLGLNIMIQKSSITPSEHSDEAPEASASATPAAPQAVAKGGQMAEASDLATLGDSVTLGKPDATREVVIGWQWTPEVQADPTKVYNSVRTVKQMVEQSGGKLKARIVNVDANPGVAPGISVGGTVKVPPHADGSIDVQAIGPALASGK